MSLDTITPEELHALQQAGEEVVIVDVRNPDEFNEFHIKNAILQPLGNFDPAETIKHVQQLGHNVDKLYITCASGMRAQHACELLQEANYHKVVLIQGGSIAWRDAGLPIG